jgi:MFS family permease
VEPSSAKLEIVARGQGKKWLNRNVFGMSLTSFLSDCGHEMVTAVLPGFLSSLGVATAALGWIEGISDAVASFVKLGAGWYSDRIGRRKGIITIGYTLTGTALAIFALAVSWPLILIGRVVSWFGRGIRGPLRDALLADSVSPEFRGKAFGLHRAGDTIGAVAGPLLGVWLLSFLPAPNPSAPFRIIFVLSLIPGIASIASFAGLVQDIRRPAKSALTFRTAFSGLPRPYVRFLRGVAVFGLGDFSHTLLILAATILLTPSQGVTRAAQIAALLYVVRNVIYALASFPIGALADRVNKQWFLASGYLIGCLTAIGTALLFQYHIADLGALAAIFILAGIYIAMQDTLEGAIPADLVATENRGSAYGLMGTVNGIGDFVASAAVGTLWSAESAVYAFGIAGVLMFLGTVVLAQNARNVPAQGSESL